MPSLDEMAIQFLKNVGPARKKLFENLGVGTVEDLLYLFPRRYEDRRQVTPLGALKPGEMQLTIGYVSAKGGRRALINGKHLFEIILEDGKARVFCVWFNQPYLANCFHPGDKVVVYGRVDVFNGRIQLVSPEHEIIADDDAALSTARIVPVYPLTKGITQRYLRKVMAQALKMHSSDLVDVLPAPVRDRQALWPLEKSLQQIHFPDDDQTRAAADRRLCFDEFFLFQVSVILRRRAFLKKKGVAHYIPEEFRARFLRALSFSLTAAQEKVMAEIAADMRKAAPMLRLLQGDVGSGKTLVSFFGCLIAVTNGNQAALMCPTEILAEQHFAALTRIFADGPFGEVRVALLSGARRKKEKAALYAQIRAGEIDVVIGTHALLEEGVEFKKLSFVAVDEQHRFGVKQRALLSAKGDNPDVLVMTATPIPRTLCLTLYGDLDVSVIDEKPPGRGEIRTYHFIGDQAEGVYRRVAEWVRKGTQAYIVYPVIEESEKADLKAAVDMYERFKDGDFKAFRIGLVHGRLPAGQAREVMEQFKRHELDILVTTTVLEVGIDVPNANVMVIEHADRFGLAQLHQLRGRIGRSEKSAVCILLGEAASEDSRRRLESIVNTTDGFQIAQKDMEIRGPGQYFGRHQHGENELRRVNPLTEMAVLEAARQEAVRLVDADPLLKGFPVIRSAIRRRYPEYLQRVLAG